MIMQVLHRLSGAAPVVRHEAERRNLRVCGDAAGQTLHVPQQRRIGVRRRGKGPEVLLRDQEHVRRRLGIDVLEDKRLLVLVDDLGGISRRTMRQNKQSAINSWRIIAL